MKKMEMFDKMTNEILKITEFVANEQTKILEKDDIIREREKFGLLSELNNYFTERLLDNNMYLDTRTVLEDKIFNQLIENPGNKFILTHGADTLCKNFWDAHHRNRISKFTFTDEYIEQVIAIINEEIAAEKLSGEKKYIKKVITSIKEINPYTSATKKDTSKKIESNVNKEETIIFDLTNQNVSVVEKRNSATK